MPKNRPLIPAMNRLWIAAILLAPLLCARANSPAPSAGTASLRTPPAPPALSLPATPPPPRSPIDYLRQLLKLAPDQREKKLAGMPEPKRRDLLLKLTEYESLPPQQRERQLQNATLRWYLRPLLELPRGKRDRSLTRMPGDYRRIVKARLELWDRLPAELQNEVLQNDWMMLYVLRFQASTRAERDDLLRGYSPGYRQSVEASLARWETLPAEQRQRISRQFQQFFELSGAEQERILQAIPDAERKTIDSLRSALSAMPTAERERCLEALRRFAQMTPGQRAEFLRNARRWKEMSDRQRETWRQLVRRMPPLPPGLVLPPLPPDAGAAVAAGRFPTAASPLSPAPPAENPAPRASDDRAATPLQ